MSIRAFLSRINDKGTLYYTLINRGCYLPSIDSVTTDWLLEQALNDKVPYSNQTLRAPPYINTTRKELVEIIKNKLPELNVSERFTLSWLKDVAFTLDSRNPLFNPMRIRHHQIPAPQNQNSHALQQYIETQMDVMIEVPNGLTNDVITPRRKALQRKGNVFKSLRTLHLQGLIQAQNTGSIDLVQILRIRGIPFPCMICLSNVGSLLYTQCCSHPLHG